MKTIFWLVLLVAFGSILGAEALAPALEPAPALGEFDLTIAPANNQYSARKALNAKVLLINASVDQETATLLPGGSPVTVDKVCGIGAPAAHVQISFVQPNTLLLAQTGGACAIKVHFAVLSRW